MENREQYGGYGKRPFWQWLLIYVIVGGLIYGVIYYVIAARRDNNNGSTGQSSLY